MIASALQTVLIELPLHSAKRLRVLYAAEVQPTTIAPFPRDLKLVSQSPACATNGNELTLENDQRFRVAAACNNCDRQARNEMDGWCYWPRVAVLGRYARQLRPAWGFVRATNASFTVRRS